MIDTSLSETRDSSWDLMYFVYIIMFVSSLIDYRC